MIFRIIATVIFSMYLVFDLYFAFKKREILKNYPSEAISMLFLDIGLVGFAILCTWLIGN